VMAAEVRTSQQAARPSSSTSRATPAESMAGVVLGMASTHVKPPRTAARAPVSIVSASAAPGWARWVCRSTSPGATTQPPAAGAAGGVGGGGRVGRGPRAREATEDGGARAGLDRLGLRGARLAQVGVQVDEPRGDDAAAGVEGDVGDQVAALALGHDGGDAAVLDEHVGPAAAGGVDDLAATDGDRLHRASLPGRSRLRSAPEPSRS